MRKTLLHEIVGRKMLMKMRMGCNSIAFFRHCQRPIFVPTSSRGSSSSSQKMEIKNVPYIFFRGAYLGHVN